MDVHDGFPGVVCVWDSQTILAETSTTTIFIAHDLREAESGHAHGRHAPRAHPSGR
jgi:hypothetical protein